MSKHFLFFRALVFVLLCAPTISFSCINLHGTTLQGSPREYSFPPGDQFRHVIGLSPEKRLQTLSSHRSGTREKSSEEEVRAVRAMLAGHPKEAVVLLEEVERTTPGKYSTAANLGTAYELAGDNGNALKWITEGIARNKGSHEGTEWLHRLILETKMRLATDPQYLATHRIIPLPEKFTADTQIDVGGVTRPISDIAISINYQLNERLLFVKPPDLVVADLLFTYAQIEAQTNVVESALQLLELSKEYGFADPALLKQLSAKYKSVLKPVKKSAAKSYR